MSVLVDASNAARNNAEDETMVILARAMSKLTCLLGRKLWTRVLENHRHIGRQ